MYHSLQIHSSTEGHLGCFQVLAIMNKAAKNICVQNFVEQKFSTPLGKYQRAWLLAHMVRVCLVFSETANCLPKWLYHFTFPLAMNESSWCSTSSPGFGGVSVLNLAIPIDVKWYLTVILICTSLMTYDVEYLFICLLAICVCPLVRCLLRSLVHIFI